jgi:subtilase family serine protease
MKHLAVRCGACLVVASLAMSWLVASASTAVASEPSAMPVGSAPVIPKNAFMTGMASVSRTLHFDIVLSPRDPAGLNSFALGVSTPGSADYRRFLTVSQFAVRFGQTRAVIQAARIALRSVGLSPGPTTVNGLVIPVSATFGRAAAALGTGFASYRLSSGRAAFANTSPPSLPPTLASLASAVIGLNDLASPMPGSGAPADPRPGIRSPDTPASAGPRACSAAAEEAAKRGAWTYPQLASAYRITALYRKHHEGSGRRIALVELEPWLRSDIATFQRCYGTHVHVTSIRVDGGAGTGPGQQESALDIETAIALAPEARLSVYDAPLEDYARSSFDEYTRIIDDDNAQVVSSSYGLCEAVVNDLDPGLIAAENTLFEQAAAEGISVFAAAGDSGSEGCYRSTGSTSLAVNDPAAQPFVTAVGGTSLTAIHPRPAERAWNDGVTSGIGAGGGGISSVWPMPRWQSGPGVISRRSSGTPCRAAGGYCREVPDVSASADPLHGYIIRWDGQWGPVGGTSAATPLWAAMTADILSAEAPPGRAGFLNPLLYAAAASWHRPSFNDITLGDNDYTGTHGGRYPAKPGYDMASGLGTPIATRLAADILAWGPKY